ncbi:hypothetical protein MSG28_012591 [Choristoneura fumiferana]|uniref:Uncharacterized protein n=1 Tax=Choristoneura fumiferana TaxID=7141 RepID=A0ACC0JH92_CHOFU|nr:hypothetical protein MSG28_012591 [Choristoneura fumiferana]
MPALSELDDFDLCMRDPGAVYCIVDLDLMEDDTPLYQFIKNFSSHVAKHYKHSKLHRGVCANQHCGLNLTHADAGESTAAAMHSCLNVSLHQGYGLQVESLSVRYCKTQADQLPYDALDWSVGAIILAILLINIGCSAYYFFWPSEEIEKNKLMMAFCIQKNWKALKHGGSADGGVFKCFQAMSDFFKALLFNARVIVQIFFVMGGLPDGIQDAAVLVVMGLAMTWVPHIGSGPMWDAVVKRERDICRQNWWQLVILMPNLFPFETLCLPQAWYLGTDTQLFLVTLVVLLVIWRWPRGGVPVLSVIMVVSLLIPFLQSYFMNLLPIRSYSDFFKALLFNARVIVQIFFVMGGFLMAYKMLLKHSSPQVPRHGYPVVPGDAGGASGDLALAARRGPGAERHHGGLAADTLPAELLHEPAANQSNWAGYHLGVLTAYFYHRAQTEKWNLRESMKSTSEQSNGARCSHSGACLTAPCCCTQLFCERTAVSCGVRSTLQTTPLEKLGSVSHDFYKIRLRPRISFFIFNKIIKTTEYDDQSLFKCNITDDIQGECISLQLCPRGVELLSIKDIKTLRSLTCGFDKLDTKNFLKDFFEPLPLETFSTLNRTVLERGLHSPMKNQNIPDPPSCLTTKRR